LTSKKFNQRRGHWQNLFISWQAPSCRHPSWRRPLLYIAKTFDNEMNEYHRRMIENLLRLAAPDELELEAAVV
jgi:hypothetical protein